MERKNAPKRFYASYLKPEEFSIVLLLVIQALDGLLTYIGVVKFGIEVERNPLVSMFMAQVGIETALIATKALAAFCSVTLYLAQAHLAIACLSVIVVYGAIAPWVIILFALV
jgi:hypothetical protein